MLCKVLWCFFYLKIDEWFLIGMKGVGQFLKLSYKKNPHQLVGISLVEVKV